MNISYKHIGENITAQQALGHSNFDKIYMSTDGLVKIIEKFEDSNLAEVHYYRAAGETENDAVQIIDSKNGRFTILTREFYGSYIIENGNTYRNNEIIGKYRQLIDDHELSICYQEIDLDSEEPILSETTKDLGYSKDETSTHYATFYYKDNGDLKYCEFNYLSDYDSEIFYQDNIILIRNKFVLTDAMYNYYLTADFLPPII